MSRKDHVEAYVLCRPSRCVAGLGANLGVSRSGRVRGTANEAAAP